MKKSGFSLLLILCLTSKLYIIAQFSYDFEIQNLDNWNQSRANAFSCTGNTPINGSYSLQHNYDSPVSDHDQISINPGFICLDSANTTWQFKVRHGYAPSSSNNWAVYLVANKNAYYMYPGTELSGYIMGVNFTGNDDTIRLWKVINGTIVEIINTHFNWEDSIGTTDHGGFRVARDKNGTWEIALAHPSNPESYKIIGVGNDAEIKSGSYFGLYYEYSSAQDRKIWLDDVFINAFIYSDTSAPKIKNIEVWSAHEIIISFSEAINESDAINPANFILANTACMHPDSACLINENTVRLYFQMNFADKSINYLIVQNIRDISDNILATDTVVFVFNKTNYRDIVINEIMYDPSPPVDLPEYEYLELLNNTNDTINLEGWTILIGTLIKSLPDVTLPPDSLLILCHAEGVTEFNSFGKTLGIFTSKTSLPNTGQSITINDRDDITIDSAYYSASLFADDDKTDGGWSLELIDPNNKCSFVNWKASEDPSGGTPGRCNSVYQPYTDSEPPKIISARPVNRNTLIIELSEPVDLNQLVDIDNYQLIPSGNLIDSVLIIASSEVQLILSQNLSNGTEYTIKIIQLTDACGNVADNLQASFTHYSPELFDVVISEVMALPSESGKLPNCEWIEIYNTTAFEIDLTGFGLADATDTVYFGTSSIQPSSYSIICDNDDFAAMKDYGAAISIASFPQLNNSGEMLQLVNNENELLHFVNYSPDWYSTEYKKEGGWSLEIIDPENPCQGAENWLESKGKNGGTPGCVNSVNAENPDNNKPCIDQIYPMDSNHLIVYFNEPVNLSQTNILPKLFCFEDSINQVVSTYSQMIVNSTLQITVAPGLSINEKYKLRITTEINDCVGNSIDTCTEILALPQMPDSLDLIINEILFHPYPFCKEFIEIYNNSEKPIDLKDIILEVVDLDKPDETNSLSFSKFQKIIWPGDYLVLTEDTSNILQTYQSVNQTMLTQVTELPSLDDNEGIIRIKQLNGLLIDDFHYSDDMHFELLTGTGGVSLERINPGCPSNAESCWHSAAESAGFATPGCENSQSMNYTLNQQEPICISPEIFSPDNDGFNDYLTIACTFQNPENVINISIFNAAGLLIKRLIKNESVGSNAIFTWDGLDEKNQAEPPGIYIVYFESFNLKGEIQKYKKTFVLAQKF